MPPSGNSSDASRAYYDWLYGQYLAAVPASRDEILWSGPVLIAIWAVVLIGFFYFYSRYANRTHRKHGELYGVASFAGSILERIGTLSVFGYVVWGAVVLWALYYAVSHILAGQVY